MTISGLWWADDNDDGDEHGSSVKKNNLKLHIVLLINKGIPSEKLDRNN
jgi:hypothetical protein